MKYPQNLNCAATNAIGKNVSGVSHDQFSRAGHATGPTSAWMLGELFHGLEYSPNNQTGRVRIIGCYIGRLVIQVAQHLTQPAG